MWKKIQILAVSAPIQFFWIPSALGSEMENTTTGGSVEAALVLFGLLAVAVLKSGSKGTQRGSRPASLDQTLFN